MNKFSNRHRKKIAGTDHAGSSRHGPIWDKPPFQELRPAQMFACSAVFPRLISPLLMIAREELGTWSRQERCSHQGRNCQTQQLCPANLKSDREGKEQCKLPGTLLLLVPRCNEWYVRT